jgi:hypothetical protein
MDAPPEGYRTNVGICLADPSLTKAPAPLPSYFPFIPSPADLVSSPAADFLRVQDRHPHRVADASGIIEVSRLLALFRWHSGIRFQ